MEKWVEDAKVVVLIGEIHEMEMMNGEEAGSVGEYETE